MNRKRKQQLLCIIFIIILCMVYEIWLGPRLALLNGRSVTEAQAAQKAQVEAQDTQNVTMQKDAQLQSGEPAKITIEKKELGADKNHITYYLVDLQLSDATRLQTALAHDTYGTDIKDTLSNMAEEHDAYFAVNGDFYGYRQDGIVIRDGVLYRDEPTDRNCLVLYRDGTAETIKESDTTGQELLDKGAWNVFSFGPVLVRDGRQEPNLTDAYKVDAVNVSISGVEPRTGIGYLGKNHFLILVVDGRQEGYSRGMNFEEMAKVFEEAGCELAYNLDGGGSVTLYQDGQIINSPCPLVGKERNISDILYVSRTDSGV